MKKLFIPFILIFIAFGSYAQNLSENLGPWFYGSVVLKNTEVAKGPIYVDLEKDIVICKDKEGAMKAFTAYQIKYFHFYDQILKAERYYRSFNTKLKRSSRNHFFEVLAVGDMYYLRQEVEMLVPNSDYRYFFADNNETIGAKTCFVYYMYQDNEMIKIKNFKKQFLDQTVNYEEKIDNYVVEENINFVSTEDQVKVIGYYNFLKEMEQAVSKK